MGECRHHVRESVEERREDGPDARQALSVALHRPEPLDVCSAVMAFLRSNLRHRPIRRANSAPTRLSVTAKALTRPRTGRSLVGAIIACHGSARSCAPDHPVGETRGAHTQGFPHRPLEVDYHTSTPRAKSFMAKLFRRNSERRAALPIVFHCFHITIARRDDCCATTSTA